MDNYTDAWTVIQMDSYTDGPLCRLRVIELQWGKKVFSQPPNVQVLPLKKIREACNFHDRYTPTMTDKMRKKSRKSLVGFLMNLFANYGGK